MSFSSSEYRQVCSELGFYPDGTTRYPISEWEAVKALNEEFPEVSWAIEEGQILKDAIAKRRAAELANSAARCVLYTGGLMALSTVLCVLAPPAGLISLTGAIAAATATAFVPQE